MPDEHTSLSPECGVFIPARPREGLFRSCSRPSMKVQSVISPGPRRGLRLVSAPAPLIQVAEYWVSSLARHAIRRELAWAADGGDSPVSSRLDPRRVCVCACVCVCARACLAVSRSHPVPVSLFVPLLLWLSLPCARARRRLSLQPMPKCHLKTKCNNLIWKRPRTHEIPRSEQPPPPLQGALGVGDWGEVRILFSEIPGSGVPLPSPFQDPVAIRNPSLPWSWVKGAKTASLERGAPSPEFPGSSGGRRCSPNEI